MPESKNLIALPSARPELSECYSADDEEIARALALAQENLLRQQKPDGHWCGELIVDSTLCSDYILFMHWCGEVDAPQRKAGGNCGIAVLPGSDRCAAWRRLQNRYCLE